MSITEQHHDPLPDETARLIETYGHTTYPADTVEAFMALLGDGQLEEAMALLADDCIYVLHIPESALPYGGETRGKAAIRATLLQMRRDFVDIVHRTTTLSFANELVRQRLEFIFRHRSSGQRLSGTGRLVWTVRDGLIVRCEEYHDGPRLAAFFNLFGREDGNNAT